MTWFSKGKFIVIMLNYSTTKQDLNQAIAEEYKPRAPYISALILDITLHRQARYLDDISSKSDDFHSHLVLARFCDENVTTRPWISTSILQRHTQSTPQTQMPRDVEEIVLSAFKVSPIRKRPTNALLHLSSLH